ncbi:tripartite tricarboxylate transporter TctB family protein [Afifella sp. IM 167]|uniref:tripartite tricarboxylate transporter TctB family protein n=1 Tax=Afifella sp. IM 167 TaxID=2033586 RepID=UPI001CCA426E|nr:tripartite tricarboxylate transporter TctB family protein [Afifella sp. IM 167]MBZ8134468.1 hypothetical protein [Afifella sp. IM 167]
MDRADLIGGMAITAIGLLMIFVIIPATTVDGMYFGLAPTFFPTLLAACITVCAAGLVAQSLYRMRHGILRSAARRRVALSRWKLLMFLLASAIALGGVLVIDWFGILIGGPVLIGTFMIFLGERSPLRVLLTATLPVGFIYVLALHVLGTPVP